MAVKFLDYFINCTDEEFEEAILNLETKELLHVVADIQESMKLEQSHFEKLSVQLQSVCSEENKIAFSQAMYLSQKKLGNLYNRSIKCLSQKSFLIGMKESQCYSELQLVMINQLEECMDFRKTLLFFKEQTSPKLQEVKPGCIFRPTKDGFSVLGDDENNSHVSNNVPNNCFDIPVCSTQKSFLKLNLKDSNPIENMSYQSKSKGYGELVTEMQNLKPVAIDISKDVLLNHRKENVVDSDHLINVNDQMPLTQVFTFMDQRTNTLVNVDNSDSNSPSVIILNEPLLCSSTSDELVQPRITSSEWDPTHLLNELYQITNPDQIPVPVRPQYINMEGFLDKLPEGRKQTSYWKGWKKRFFQLSNGYLHCYEKGHMDKGMIKLNLMGGFIELLDPLVLGIDDGKGHYMVVRATCFEEYELWRHALETQVEENSKSYFIELTPFSSTSIQRKIVIIDLGSSSIRAGFASTDPCLPQLYFPSICAWKKNSNQRIYGFEAVLPEVRSSSILTYPIKYSAKLDKFASDVDSLPGLFETIFTQLEINPSDCQILVSSSHKYGTYMQTALANILFEQFCAAAVCMLHQSLLAFYSYNATSGILVDVGERIDILPITDGYIVKSGITSLPYGGQKISDKLYRNLQECNYSLLSDVDCYMVRYIMEKSCYCAYDLKQELEHFKIAPDNFKKTFDIQKFGKHLPWPHINVSSCRFQATEGLFKPKQWGIDNKGIHKLVIKAIQECPMDSRRQMFKSIFLSGSVTLLPGFVERLEKELIERAPPTVKVQIHPSPYRGHAAYIGASVLSNMNGFEKMLVRKDEWLKDKIKSLEKWSSSY